MAVQAHVCPPRCFTSAPLARRLYRTLLFTLPLLLGACGAPTVHDSKVLGAKADKLTRLQLVYRVVHMRLGETRKFGSGNELEHLIPEIGVDSFGAPLARQAAPVFAAHGVTVTQARIFEGSENIRIEAAADGARIAPMLVITPVRGTIVTNRFSTRANYVFNILLLDPNTRRALWRASVDTTTISGDPGTPMYDDAYAGQVLKAVAEQMLRDGLI